MNTSDYIEYETNLNTNQTYVLYLSTNTNWIDITIELPSDNRYWKATVNQDTIKQITSKAGDEISFSSFINLLKSELSNRSAGLSFKSLRDIKTSSNYSDNSQTPDDAIKKYLILNNDGTPYPITMNYYENNTSWLPDMYQKTIARWKRQLGLKNKGWRVSEEIEIARLTKENTALINRIKILENQRRPGAVDLDSKRMNSVSQERVPEGTNINKTQTNQDIFVGKIQNSQPDLWFLTGIADATPVECTNKNNINTNNLSTSPDKGSKQRPSKTDKFNDMTKESIQTKTIETNNDNNPNSNVNQKESEQQKSVTDRVKAEKTGIIAKDHSIDYIMNNTASLPKEVMKNIDILVKEIKWLRETENKLNAKINILEQEIKGNPKNYYKPYTCSTTINNYTQASNSSRSNRISKYNQLLNKINTNPNTNRRQEYSKGLKYNKNGYMNWRNVINSKNSQRNSNYDASANRAKVFRSISPKKNIGIYKVSPVIRNQRSNPNVKQYNKWKDNLKTRVNAHNLPNKPYNGRRRLAPINQDHRRVNTSGLANYAVYNKVNIFQAPKSHVYITHEEWSARWNQIEKLMKMAKK